MTTETKTKWYILNWSGDIVYLGEFATFDEADESGGSGGIWVADEENARKWLRQLKSLLEMKGVS